MLSNERILEKLKKKQKIYGFMYGEPYINNKIIDINIKDTEIVPYAIIYRWGWPGSDFNMYKFEDYGRTWAFTRKEMFEAKRKLKA